MKNTILVFSVILFLTLACSNSEKKEKAAPLSADKITETMKTETPDADEIRTRHGKAVYMQYCATCHMVDGSGVSGIQPPLNDPRWIKDKDKLIRIVLKGISGEIEVNGETYNNLMPPHGHLSTGEIASVLSYIRSNFGNDFEPVSNDEVAEIRKELQLN
ncbi:MAG: cytochrome c [Prolixibacteraceae bacterium]|jgi:mono/diheme cytochrome c family protein|nr:cytochrome c [Prolixibacteraceae bacterium]